MTARAFEPRPMKLSLLTAALQELTPRDRRDADPDLAIEDWLGFARDLDCPAIQLSAALHPSQADVPAEALLDPVANHLDLRGAVRQDPRRPRSLRQCAPPAWPCRTSPISTTCWLRTATRGAASTSSCCGCLTRRCCSGVDAVCGFVGRNADLEMDQNLAMFEAEFIPLLKEAKARGLTYRVEQCPMPGWVVTDRWHNNIAYAPGPWIALHRICETARRG